MNIVRSASPLMLPRQQVVFAVPFIKQQWRHRQRRCVMLKDDGLCAGRFDL